MFGPKAIQDKAKTIVYGRQFFFMLTYWLGSIRYNLENQTKDIKTALCLLSSSVNFKPKKEPFNFERLLWLDAIDLRHFTSQNNFVVARSPPMPSAAA